MNKLQTDWT